MAIVEHGEESMKMKDRNKIAIRDTNKRMIVFIFSVVLMVLLLNPMSSALTLSLSNQGATSAPGKIIIQSDSTSNKEPAPDLTDATQKKEEPKDIPSDNIQGPPTDETNDYIGNTESVVDGINDTNSNDEQIQTLFNYPEDLEVGDILFWDVNCHSHISYFILLPHQFFGHCAIYIGNNQIVEATLLPYRGVQITNLTENNTIDGCEYFFAVGRVKNADDTQIQNAVNWALGFLGDPYQEWWLPWITPIKTRMEGGIYDHYWYCSELVWAAYYYSSNKLIDLDKDGWGPDPYFIIPSVSPEEIYNNTVEIKQLYRYDKDSPGLIATGLSVDSYSASNEMSYSNFEDAALTYFNSDSSSNALSFIGSSLNTDTTNTLLNDLSRIFNGY